jgi:hypothetical protein
VEEFYSVTETPLAVNGTTEDDFIFDTSFMYANNTDGTEELNITSVTADKVTIFRSTLQFTCIVLL